MRYGRIASVVLVILAILAGEWLWLEARREASMQIAGPVITSHAAGPGGPFALIDHRGNPVTDRTYRGKYLTVVFGYTFCPDVCPTTLAAVAAAMDLLGSRADSVQPIFVTVDPERDTPAVLADYVAAFHPSMVGLTGSLERIREVAREYRVYFSKLETGDDTYPVDHSAYIYLVGPDGDVLTYWKHDVSPNAMAAAIERFLPPQVPAADAGAPAPPRT